MRRILVVGGGGREHALLRALGRGHEPVELLCAPGNAGIARDGVTCLDVQAEDINAITAAAHETRCDLVVVGPEAPLVHGLVDALHDAGVRAFGPTAAAARIEGSKAYAKQVMQQAGVPTAAHALARNRAEAERHLHAVDYPVVLKADVLASGKGVAVCETPDEAEVALSTLFSQRRFGETAVLVEEYLSGPELSLFALCDGKQAVMLAPAQDYKRIYDGDLGPNTGGMGSYSPVAGLDDAACRGLCEQVHQPVVDELRRRGTPYHGVLYAGLIMTAAGPKVLEYNCRFGDPEAQAILPRLRGDLLELLEASTRPGGLAGTEPLWSSEWAVTVVLASGGYPESASKGDVISGVYDAEQQGVEILHAATAYDHGRLVTAGGRVLNVTGLGQTQAQARERAYDACERIHFEGMQLRHDVALASGSAQRR